MQQKVIKGMKQQMIADSKQDILLLSQRCSISSKCFSCFSTTSMLLKR
jgi:hypothetical protein